MANFHKEHTFEIVKQTKEFGLSFSEESYKMILDAIVQFIGKEVLDHWACKHLTVNITLDGEYNPEEKI
jgi:hypothetical protein